MEFVTSLIPANTTLVRVLVGEGPEYDRMIAVTDLGDTLYLQGWIGPPLTPSEWRSAKAQLYPKATKVAFERWCPRTKSFRKVSIKI